VGILFPKAKASLKTVLMSSMEKRFASVVEDVQVIVTGPLDAQFVGVVMVNPEMRGAARTSKRQNARTMVD